MKLSNVKISVRLGAGFGLVLVLMVVIMMVGIKGMGSIQEGLDRIYNVNNVRIALANDLIDCINAVSIETRNIVLNKDQTAMQDNYKKIESARAKYQEALDKLNETDKTEEGQAHLATIREAVGEAQSSSDRVIELSLANKDSEAFTVLTNETGAALEKVSHAIFELIKYQEERSKYRFEEAVNTYAGARMIMLLAGGLAILMGALVAVFLARSVSKPVAELARVANTAASGDLTADIALDAKDEVGQLAQAFKAMVVQMRKMVSEIAEKANLVAGSAQTLNSTSQQTSAAANETAATMGEISTTVEQVTSNIQEISAASEVATDHAGRGNKGIESVSGQMQIIANSSREASLVIDGLSKKSRDISQIVELITSIADQTNLLALNAAIEAARAGEQGRGFAVVAEEVRKLAEQSSSAAKEIKNLISAIQVESQRAVETMTAGGREVEAGTMVVREVGEAFQEIINSVQGLTSQIQEVASATEQMSAGVQNVAASTEEQTAAMEEVSASAESLSSLAEELKSLVGNFKV